MAKFLHIVGALIVWLILCDILYFMGWGWPVLPLSVVFVMYVATIWRSPSTNPVPFSRAANENLDAYLVYCSIIGKKPSAKDEDDAWIPNLPYSVKVMAAFYRLIGAMRRYGMTTGNLGRFKKLVTEAEGFVKACKVRPALVSEQVLDDLILRAYPNCPLRDRDTLHSVLGDAGK